MLPEESTPTKSAPSFGSIARCVTLDDAEHALLGDHSLANQGGRDWAALSGNTACTLGIVGVPSNCHAKVDALGTFAGRLGFALESRDRTSDRA